MFMEFNRNQFLMAGLVILFLGIQFRVVESFTLNRESSEFLAARFPQKQGSIASPSSFTQFSAWTGGASPAPLRTVHPPRWLGYALISVGVVLVLHSLAMKKPG